MAQMLIRNLPAATAELIKQQAKSHGRSAEAEAVALIEIGLRQARQDWLAETNRLRGRLKARSSVPAEDAIREDRDR